MVTQKSSEPEDRRTSRRVGCKLRVMNNLRGVVTDISEGGARFSFHHTISLHEDLDVPIKIAERIIWARVHPLWVKPAPMPNVIDVGGSFTVISEEDREAVRQYIQGNLLRKPFGFIERFLGNNKTAEC